MKKTSKDLISTYLSRFLLHYRITPHSTTGVSPTEMLFGRRLCSKLDLLVPNITTRVEQRQEVQKATHGDKVYVCSFTREIGSLENFQVPQLTFFPD